MMRLSQFLIVSCFSSCILVSCTSKKSESEQVTQVPAQTIANVDYEVSEDKAALAQYYKLDHILKNGILSGSCHQCLTIR